MSTTISYRAGLIRKIEENMKRVDRSAGEFEDGERDFQEGQLDAYAHVLLLLKDESL